MKASHLVTLAFLVPVALGACKRPGSEAEALTRAEARDALEEATLSGQAESLMAGSVEIATDFTIGQAAQTAAGEIRDFVTSQLPCAELTLESAKLTIEYGKLPGTCTYRGQTYSGVHVIDVSRNEASDVEVKHTWDELSNGIITMSGWADVTWSVSQKSRHVVHELTWTRVKDGRTGVGSGDRTQQPLAGGIGEGFQVDGSRTWEGQAGRWDLAIQGVQMRWADPVPQAGTYLLATPQEKSVSFGFARVDESTIRVTVASGGHEFQFNVTRLGFISGA